jgi:hypothetical protein
MAIKPLEVKHQGMFYDVSPEKDGLKFCAICYQWKPLREFRDLPARPRVGFQGGRACYCWDCSDGRPARKWRPASVRAKEKEKAKERGDNPVPPRSRNPARAPHLTDAAYARVLQKQRTKCALCGEAPALNETWDCRSLVVDHDHTTGEFRGLVCRLCNWRLAIFAMAQTEKWKQFEQQTARYIEEKTKQNAGNLPRGE